MTSYSAAAESAAEKCAQWLRDNPNVERPSDVWKLPWDCPLWHSDLSGFQASWAWAKAKEMVP